jgi:hypothetical protein
MWMTFVIPDYYRYTGWIKIFKPITIKDLILTIIAIILLPALIVCIIISIIITFLLSDSMKKFLNTKMRNKNKS